MYKKTSGLLLLLMLAGVVIVAFPDSDKRLFSIGKAHGPSFQDTIGLILILISYVWLAVKTWKNKYKILKFRNLFVFKLGLMFFGLGLGLIIASVGSDYPYWWIFGVIVMVLVQIPVFYLVLK